jgi:hypothetical protein
LCILAALQRGSSAHDTDLTPSRSSVAVHHQAWLRNLIV